MIGGPRVSYLVPVYNEEEIIEATTHSVTGRLARLPGSEVLLLENGSTDGSVRLVDRLAEEMSGPEVRVAAADVPKGFGNAIRHGIGLAQGDLLVITASDLPFGFSDLDQVLEMDPRPQLVIGSKAHPASRVGASAGRRVLSEMFRLSRRLIIGLAVGDSQGSLFLDAPLARHIQPYLTAPDFFLSTEIVAFASRSGARPVEIPVDYEHPRTGSTVRPLHDGVQMARALFGLRRRLVRSVELERRDR